MIKRLSSILEGIIKYSNDRLSPRLSPETNLEGMAYHWYAKQKSGRSKGRANADGKDTNNNL